MILITILLVLAVIFGIVLVIGGIGVGIYNKLVTLRNEFKNQFAQIDVQLKRRHDLIPNLVETAKGYMAHERGTLDEVVAARNGAAADPADSFRRSHRCRRRAESRRGGRRPDAIARPGSSPWRRRTPT